MVENNVAYPGGFSYYAEHFGHKKYNLIWEMSPVLLGEALAFDLESQEQWAEDAKFYQPPKSQMLLPDNANCLAVQAYLRMNSLNYEIVEKKNAEYMSPSGKVPFIKSGAFLVTELESIVDFLKNKGITLSERLTKEEWSDMRAYMSLANYIFANAELYLCWCDQETYETDTWERYGSVLAWPLNYVVTWQKRRLVKNKLSLMEWGNKDMKEVVKNVENCCEGLSIRLDNSEYFFGDKPTELDALVFGHISAILKGDPSKKLSSVVVNFKNLVSFCNRIEERYFKH